MPHRELGLEAGHHELVHGDLLAVELHPAHAVTQGQPRAPVPSFCVQIEHLRTRALENFSALESV